MIVQCILLFCIATYCYLFSCDDGILLVILLLRVLAPRLSISIPCNGKDRTLSVFPGFPISISCGGKDRTSYTADRAVSNAFSSSSLFPTGARSTPLRHLSRLSSSDRWYLTTHVLRAALPTFMKPFIATCAFNLAFRTLTSARRASIVLRKKKIKREAWRRAESVSVKSLKKDEKMNLKKCKLDLVGSDADDGQLGRDGTEDTGMEVPPQNLSGWTKTMATGTLRTLTLAQHQPQGLGLACDDNQDEDKHDALQSNASYPTFPRQEASTMIPTRQVLQRIS